MTFNWENACVSPHSSILDALQVINQSAFRAGFVVDDDGIFLGMVTDGDIRRGLLNRLSVDECVREVMNTTPLTCKPSDSHESVRRIMEVKKLLQMPIVEDQRLLNVLTMAELTSSKRFDNPVFLMAGGYGRRLQSLTEDCPKPLLKVGSKPILETILENFASLGFYRFYISTHYLSDKLIEHFGDGHRWGVEIQYTYEDKPLGTGGALGLLPADLPDLPIIMMNGDILTKVDFAGLLNYHQQSGALATMCVREYEYQVPYGVVKSTDFRVTSMREKPVYHYYINAGIYVIDHSVISQVEPNVAIDMPTLLNQQIDKGQQVSMYPLDEYWIDIGRMNDFKQAQKDIAEHL